MVGVPFLQKNPSWHLARPNARLVVEIAWGADLTADPATWTWTDITTDLLQSDNETINIAPMGRSDNTSKTQPAACSFKVGANGSAIKYMKGPQSPNFPNVHQNVPLRVWITLTGLLAGMLLQFQGEAWSFKPSFNKKGNVAAVTIKAGGKMRQLTQGKAPTQSAAYREFSRSNPTRYWSLEDGFLADKVSMLGTAPGGVPTLPWLSTTTQHPPVPGGVTPAIGCGPMPQFNTGGSLTLPLNGTSANGWTVEAVVYGGLGEPAVDSYSTAPEQSIKLLSIYDAGQIDGIFLTVSPHNATNPGGRLSLTRINGGFDTLYNVTLDGLGWTLWDGKNHHIGLSWNKNGGSTDWVLWIDGAVQTGGTAAHAYTAADQVILNSGGWLSTQAPLGIGHVLFHDGVYLPPASHGSAAQGWPGETATARLTRLFLEEGVPIDITGTSTTTMGPQGVDSFMNNARECEAADLGVLGDGLGPGCFYVARSARYSQSVSLALDANAGELKEAPDPQDDDQYLRNMYTVKRKNGSSETYADEDGPLGTNAVGTYDSTPGSDLNLATGAPLLNYATWLVHQGTVEGYRYPTMSLDLRNIQAKAGSWAGMRPGARMTVDHIADVTPEHPDETVDVLAEGWSQQLSPHIWTAVVNCSPAQPWDVDALNTKFRLEMSGQKLNSSLAPGATTLSLKTDPGHALFTTSAQFPADFPVMVMVGGWPVRVTAASGSSSPQTLTIDPAPNTATLPSLALVTLWRPSGLAL